MSHLKEEVQSRKTFAIISHPDAGKTTITEQLLLYGGAIRQAGTVKGKKTGTFAKSDWMDIEKQRGISVTSSVMQFDYDGKRGKHPRHSRTRGLFRRYLSDLDGGGCCGHGSGLCQGYRGPNQEIV